MSDFDREVHRIHRKRMVNLTLQQTAIVNTLRYLENEK
jgi:hypothetical protein